MKRYFFPLVALLFVGVACNNSNQPVNKGQSSDDKDDAKMEKKMSHDKEEESESKSSSVPPVPPGSSVSFTNIETGDTLTSPVHVKFGLEGMDLEPAGEVNEGKGHHHLIINGDPLPVGEVVPADSVNIHYGDAQTEDKIDLPLGKHMLTTQFADGFHRSYGEAMSESVVITVVEKK